MPRQKRFFWFFFVGLPIFILVCFGLFYFLREYYGLPGRTVRKGRRIHPSTSVSHAQFNFHVVTPGFWRSAQPTEESLRRMKSYGLKTVVNLRRTKEVDRWEREFAKTLGIQYYHFPMGAGFKRDPTYLREILSVVVDPENQPVLVHCHGGKDRTGLIAGIYKMEYTDEDFEDIHREMRMYGYDEERFPKLIQTVKNWRRISREYPAQKVAA